MEGLILLSGLWIFLAGSVLSRARKIWLTVLALVTLVFTVLGMTVAPPPPSVTAMAASSVVTVLVVSGLAGWLGMRNKVENIEPRRSRRTRSNSE